MSPRTGRPIAGDAKKAVKFQLRLTEEELNELDYCAQRMSGTRSDVVRTGIKLVRKQLDEK